MSIKKVRNEKFDPYINEEGFYKTTMISEQGEVGNFGKETPSSDESSGEKFPPHLRLYHHKTLSSARRHANFINTRSPRDSLDVVLSSEYNHSDNLFFSKEEVFKQPETNDKTTFRRLRNTKDVFIKPPVYLSHPLIRGGISERQSIHSVKLINSGVHSMSTNHGYSRQNVDGNFYNY